MDPSTVFCPNLVCPVRRPTRQSKIGIHSRKDKRFLCTVCHKMFSPTKGTALYRLRITEDRHPYSDVACPRLSPTGYTLTATRSSPSYSVKFRVE
jgi:hypothetical protein